MATTATAPAAAALDAPATVRRNYEYRIYPRPAQARALDTQLHLANDLWNAALEQRRRLWRDYGVSITFGEQSAQLTEARRELPWLQGMNALAQHDVLRRLDKAMQAFFRRVKAGEKAAGFPRFHRFDPYGGSITWAQHGNGCRGREGQRLYLQGVGNVKMRWHRPLPADSRVTQVTVNRRAGCWYAVLCLELPTPQPLPATGLAVGVDMGVRTFATLSTGEQLPGAGALRRAEKSLLRSQRNVTRKRRGSRRRHHARRDLARAHDRARRVRRAHAHQAARELVNRFDLIAVEDLRIRNMVRSAKGTREQPGTNVRAKAGLNRSIADAGWRQFLTLLESKAADAGRQVVVVPAAGTSQTCSSCGAYCPKALSQRIHRCSCGVVLDRDHNAAINILRLAREPAWRAAMRRPAETHPRPPQPARDGAVATVSGDGRDRDPGGPQTRPSARAVCDASSATSRMMSPSAAAASAVAHHSAPRNSSPWGMSGKAADACSPTSASSGRPLA